MPDLRLKIPPVAVCLAFAAPMGLLARLTPSLRLDIPGRTPISVAISALALIIAALGIREFVRVRTTVLPHKPHDASSLVSTGIYRLTRNPMYVGLLLLLVAYAVYLANPLTLLPIPGFVAYMNRFQIIPEEEALRQRFGSSATDYQQRVRRWL